MIKAVVDIGNKELKPKMIIDGSSYGQYAHELAWILDRIIIDGEIKESPSIMSLSTDEQCQFIVERRKWYTEQILNSPIDIDYIQSTQSCHFNYLSGNWKKFKYGYEIE